MAKILIVDDESDFNQLLKTRLEADRHEIVIAKDGKEGLEKAESENPDLIVLDVMTPEMDGYEVCRTLKNDFRFKKIPIIILSTLSQEDDIKAGIEAGADAYISKPYDANILLAKVEELLKKT